MTVVALPQPSSSSATGQISVAVLTFKALNTGAARLTPNALSLASAIQASVGPALIPVSDLSDRVPVITIRRNRDGATIKPR